MAKNDVEISVAASTANAQQAWIQMIGLMRQMQTEMKRMHGTLELQAKRGNKELNSMRDSLMSAGKSLRNFLGIGTGMGALLTAFRAVRTEIQAIMQMYEEVTGDRMSMLDAREIMRQFASTESIAEIDRILRRARTPVPTESLYRMTQQMISAQIMPPEMHPTAATLAVDIATAFPMLRKQEDVLGQLGTAVVAMEQAWPKEMQDRETTLAIMDQAIQALRTEDIGPFAKHGAQGAARIARNYGASPELAFGLMAAVGMTAGDPTNRITSNAMVRFYEQLQEQAIRQEIPGGGDPYTAIMSDSPQAQRARRALRGIYFREDPDYQRYAATVAGGRADELKGEAKAIGSLLALLEEGDNPVKQALRQAMELLEPDYAVREFRRKQQARRDDPLTQFWFEGMEAEVQYQERLQAPVSEDERFWLAYRNIMSMRERFDALPRGMGPRRMFYGTRTHGMLMRPGAVPEDVTAQFYQDRIMRELTELYSAEQGTYLGAGEAVTRRALRRGDLDVFGDSPQVDSLLEELRQLNERIMLLRERFGEEIDTRVIELPPEIPAVAPPGAAALEGQ